MAVNKILIIHPYDKTTLFLNELKNHLANKFEDIITIINVETNESSHIKCLETINAFPEDGLIIFLGHGRSDSLAGSKGDWFTPNAGLEEIANEPDLFYFKETFIGKNNISVFKDKKVFCLSCRSAEKVADYSAQNGVKCFLGFGNIPTSEFEFIEEVTVDVVKAMQIELNYIIKTSLSICIEKELTFENLIEHIRFITNQRITNILVNQKDFDERYLLVDYLYYLKKEAKTIGFSKLKLVE